jgi:hypothetical protein
VRGKGRFKTCPLRSVNHKVDFKHKTLEERNKQFLEEELRNSYAESREVPQGSV